MSIFRNTPYTYSKANGYQRKIEVRLTDKHTNRTLAKDVTIERNDLADAKDFVRVEAIETLETLFKELYGE
ncbi:MAG: hypothetical protein DRI46_10460 [Chloroflexi bacterium]|nr:MAG: hypothetical protein DRI46_10460 [Chloroflexota bacterium]